MAKGSLIGQTVLGYKVEELIGTGSFGSVYKVMKSNASGVYTRALKHITIPTRQQYNEVLNSMGGDYGKANDYFEQILNNIVTEIKILSSLSEENSANIVTYHENEIEEHDNPRHYDVYILMEYLTPFTDYLENNEMTVSDVVSLGLDMLSALKVCHNQRIIHRDIKFDNIFISSGKKYKLGDFGVSKVLKEKSKAASMKGTPNYIAPEVYLGREEYTASVDLYSLGIVLYKLLNFMRNPFMPDYPLPYDTDDEDNAFSDRMQGKIPQAPSNAPEALGNVILKAISGSKERYQNASEFYDDLLAASDGITPDIASQKINTVYQHDTVVTPENEQTMVDNRAAEIPTYAATIGDDFISSAPTQEDTYVIRNVFNTTMGETNNSEATNSLNYSSDDSTPPAVNEREPQFTKSKLPNSDDLFASLGDPIVVTQSEEDDPPKTKSVVEEFITANKTSSKEEPATSEYDAYSKVSDEFLINESPSPLSRVSSNLLATIAILFAGIGSANVWICTDLWFLVRIIAPIVIIAMIFMLCLKNKLSVLDKICVLVPCSLYAILIIQLRYDDVAAQCSYGVLASITVAFFLQKNRSKSITALSVVSIISALACLGLSVSYGSFQFILTLVFLGITFILAITQIGFCLNEGEKPSDELIDSGILVGKMPYFTSMEIVSNLQRRTSNTKSSCVVSALQHARALSARLNTEREFGLRSATSIVQEQEKAISELLVYLVNITEKMDENNADELCNKVISTISTVTSKLKQRASMMRK